MTVQDIIQIIQACQSSSVSSFKFEGLEISFSTLTSQSSNCSIANPIPQMGYAAPIPTANAMQAAEISPEEEAEIKHRVEELTSIMKLDDAELIDRMFPLPPDETEGVA